MTLDEDLVAEAMKRAVRDRSLNSRALENLWGAFCAVLAENVELRAALDGTRPVEVPEPRTVGFGPAHRS